MKKKRVKVAVGLSGGVDSSVAAALLKEAGYDVLGLYMKVYDDSVALKVSEKHSCYGPDEKEDIDSAASVCNKIGIPFHVVDLKREFNKHVIEYFRSEYLSGRTPNPCIVCNRNLKFGFLLEKAKRAGIGFDRFATGHYARIIEKDGRFLLKKPFDMSKDQTYFLYGLTQDQLSHTIFPIGEHDKTNVRDIARSLHLDTSDRPESQDFITGNDYSPFFRNEEVEVGDIVDENGNILGRHRGIIYYTIGQRKGLGISAPRPIYVSRIDTGKNRIVVSDRDALLSKGLIARDLNFIPVEKLDKAYRVKVKIRLQHKGAEAELFPYGEGRAKIVFDESQMSVTPGQSAVFYVDDTVLGGGIIEQAT